jgi:hypothetical protein
VRECEEIAVLLRGPDGQQEWIQIDPEDPGNLGEIPSDPEIAEALRDAAIHHAIGRWLHVRSEDWVVEEIKVVPRKESTSLTPPSAKTEDICGAVVRCRSLLKLANFLLPHSAREDALDEWMDEIQGAAEEGRPFRRRALSILCRSLPPLALRARLPVRARRGES